MPPPTSLSAKQALAVGMGLAVTAREHPKRLAIASMHGDRSFAALNQRANQLARTLRSRGLCSGDSMALLCSNRPEFAAAYFAALRSGLRITPINWHLTGDEIAYILDNCEAKAFLADARYGAAAAAAVRGASMDLPARLAIGGEIPGFDSYDEALDAESPDDIGDPVRGSQMLYTSGTTGRPKGVHRKSPARRAAQVIGKRIEYRPESDIHLCTGPLYHAAPLGFSLVTPLASGCGVVLMDGWDAERSLELIDGFGVTHTHMVPTMFHRLLSLPEWRRASHPLSSLRVVLHGAAPCPVSVKRALIEWLGPIVFEYYAATEGWGSLVDSEEWLARPGTVGRPSDGQVEIRDDEGKRQPPGSPGAVFLLSPSDSSRFEYFKDPDKTSGTYDSSGHYFTLGDLGYLDEDGYLFLCDRSADVIITGGVNVYPAEIDAVLLGHPAVGDAATIGIPNEEWGESVLSVIELAAGCEASGELAAELIAHCRAELAHFKCPKDIEFADELPRHETGKILRRQLRERHWQGRERRI